jgi:hypothetical protein
VNKWVKIGGALLAVAWAPFLYAELSSGGAEQKERALPTDATHDDSTAVQAIEGAHEEAAGKDAPAPAPAPTAEAPAAAPEPAAVPAAPQPAAAPAAATPTAVPAAPPANGPGAQQVQQLAAQPGQPAAEVNDDVAVAEPAEEDEPDPTPPTTSGPAEALKQAYDQQPRDPLWAADAETKISALFGGDEVPNDLLHSASCRKAVCKVELRWTTAHAAAYVTAYEAAQKLLGGEVGVEPVGSLSDKGEQLVNLYLTRKGYTVADLTR